MKPLTLIRIRSAVVAALLLSLMPVTQLSAQNLQRTLELRDGSLLRVRIENQEIPWRNVAQDGTVTETPLQLSNVERIVFSKSPATERVAEVRRLLNLLGAASYAQRERAQTQLTDNGGMFREIIRQYTTDDSEIQYRLKEILKEIEDKTADAIENQFDVATVSGEGASRDGDVGDWQMEVEHAGLKFNLDRGLVLEMHSDVPELDFGDPDVKREMKRESEAPQQKKGPLPPDYVRIDFDMAPDKSEVSKGQSVEDLYIPVGAQFRSESGASKVNAFRYNCGGVSGDQCAANAKPAYSGVMSIDFCIPGKSNFPAGVNYVGFFISSIKPDGTSLEAYNAFGRMITSIRTVTTGSDYLAIRSGEPIASIRIVPNVEIDADFAIDDLFFTHPRPLIESGDPEKVTVVLNSADRLQASSATFSADSVQLQNLTHTDQPLTLKLSEIAVVIPRRVERKTGDDDFTGYVQLIDQGVRRVVVKNGAIREVRSGEPIEPKRIASYWSKVTDQSAIPEKSKIPANGAIIVAGDDAVELSAFSMGADWIESDSLKSRPDLKFTWSDSPAIHFRQPAASSELAGVVRTTDGEAYWLGGDNNGSISKLSDDGVTLSVDGAEVEIPLDEIASVRFPRQ